MHRAARLQSVGTREPRRCRTRVCGKIIPAEPPRRSNRPHLRARRRRETLMRVMHIVSGRLFGGVETLLVTLARSRDLCPAMDPEFALCFDGRLSEELGASGVAV